MRNQETLTLLKSFRFLFATGEHRRSKRRELYADLMPGGTHKSRLSPNQLDRAIGSMLGLACGDALGAGYEFKARVPYTQPIAMNGGNGWELGEWTDDTDMAICIAQVAASGHDLLTKQAQDNIVQKWIDWTDGAKDVGLQTSAVLELVGTNGDAIGARNAALEVHNDNGRSAGNGSLMRTAPIALAYLHDQESLTIAARQISDLTHYESDAGDACVLWCQAIRHTVLHGELPDFSQLVRFLPPEDQQKWLHRISEAYKYESFQFENNGWVVAAFQAALSAIAHAGTPPEIPELGLSRNQHLQISLERAVRCGGDTDTVAAIAGSLVGALWGARAIPESWRSKLHGFPEYLAEDLVHLALQIATKGEVNPGGYLNQHNSVEESWSPFNNQQNQPVHPFFDPRHSQKLQVARTVSGDSAALLATEFGLLQRHGGAWIESRIDVDEIAEIERELTISEDLLVDIAELVARFDELEFSRA